MKKLFALVLALSMVLTFAGCGGSTSSSSAAASQGSSAAASEEASEAATEGGGRTFGCVVFASTAQSSQREAEAFTEYVESQGDEAVVLYAEGDLQKMYCKRDCQGEFCNRTAHCLYPGDPAILAGKPQSDRPEKIQRNRPHSRERTGESPYAGVRLHWKSREGVKNDYNRYIERGIG